MAGKIEVRVGAAVRELEQVAGRLKDASPVLTGAVDRIVLGFLRRQFETEGAAGGTPWAPLSSVTLALKGRYRRARMGVLRFTNRLMGSLTKRGSPDQLFQVTGQQYSRGTRVPYAVFHQSGYITGSIFGRPRKRPVQVPARPMVPPDGLPPAELAQVRAALERYYTTGDAG